MNRKKDKDELEPYNWIDTLIRFAQISGTFAGFCITFIVLIIGGNIPKVGICSTGITYGQLSVLLFGICGSLFIFASQRFLRAQEHNLWKLPAVYKNVIRKIHGPSTKDEWENMLVKSDEKCRRYQREGRWAYNGAILLMITGLFFAISLYNTTIAVSAFIIGLLLEVWQILN